MLLAGVVGLVSATSATRVESERTHSALTDGDSTSPHPRVTVTSAQDDDQHLALDLPATTLAPAIEILAVDVTTTAADRLASQHSTLPAVANGRAPPPLA